MGGSLGQAEQTPHTPRWDERRSSQIRGGSTDGTRGGSLKFRDGSTPGGEHQFRRTRRSRSSAQSSASLAYFRPQAGQILLKPRSSADRLAAAPSSAEADKGDFRRRRRARTARPPTSIVAPTTAAMNVVRRSRADR